MPVIWFTNNFYSHLCLLLTFCFGALLIYNVVYLFMHTHTQLLATYGSQGKLEVVWATPSIFTLLHVSVLV